MPKRCLPSSSHCDLIMRAAEIAQPNLLRTLMVYPIMYELLPSQERVGIKKGSQGVATFTGVPPKKGKYRWEVQGQYMWAVQGAV